MPAPRQHPLDEEADEILDWLNTEPDWYANELIGEYRAPFAAQISETDKLAAYRRMFYQSDNEGNILYDKPNAQGRQQLYNRVTPDQYVQIAKAVGPQGGMEYINNLDIEEDDDAESSRSIPSRY